jgi:hypothetical protein
VRVVTDSQGVRHCDEQRIGSGYRLVRSEFFDIKVGGVRAAEDGARV